MSDRRDRRPRAEDPEADPVFDAEFLRTQRSDLPFVAFRLVTVALVFWFMARAIRVHDLTAGYLLLPLAVEFLTIGWVGVVLDRFFIDDPAFSKTTKPGLVVFWTIAIAAVIAVVLAVDQETFELARVAPGWRDGWRRVVDSGLIWAFVAELVSLIASTVPEVVRWRRLRGRFVWTSIIGVGLRFAALLLLGIAGFFLFVVGSELLAPWLEGRASRAAWLVWTFLLCVDLGALWIGVKIHRDLQREVSGSGDGSTALPPATSTGER